MLLQSNLILLLTCGLLQQDAGFVDLFDGKTLNGWVYVGQGRNQYFAKDGILVCPVGETGNLLTEKEYSNFILRFEFRMEEGGNNGVAIRSPLEKDLHLKGIEIQILDDQAPRYRSVLKATQYHGSLYGVFPARRGFLRKTGAWNEQTILADHGKIQVVLNGETILDEDVNTVHDPQVLAEHPGVKRPLGHLGFLGHLSHLEFRNIRIKKLP